MAPLNKFTCAYYLACWQYCATYFRLSAYGLNAVQADTGMGHGMAAILTTLPFVMMGLLALLGAGLAHRFGERRTLLCALLLLALGCGARLFAVGVGALSST